MALDPKQGDEIAFSRLDKPVTGLVLKRQGLRLRVELGTGGKQAWAELKDVTKIIMTAAEREADKAIQKAKAEAAAQAAKEIAEAEAAAIAAEEAAKAAAAAEAEAKLIAAAEAAKEAAEAEAAKELEAAKAEANEALEKAAAAKAEIEVAAEKEREEHEAELRRRSILTRSANEAAEEARNEVERKSQLLDEATAEAARLASMLEEQKKAHELELNELFDALKAGDSRGPRARGVTYEMVSQWDQVREVLESGVLTSQTIKDIFDESYRDAVVGDSGIAAMPSSVLKSAGAHLNRQEDGSDSEDSLGMSDDDDDNGGSGRAMKKDASSAVAALFLPPEAGGLATAQAIPLAQFKSFIEKLDKATELGYHKKTVKSAVSTAALAAAANADARLRGSRGRAATISGNGTISDVYKPKRRNSQFVDENTHALTGSSKAMAYSERARGAATIAAAIKATPKAQGRLAGEMAAEIAAVMTPVQEATEELGSRATGAISAVGDSPTASASARRAEQAIVDGGWRALATSSSESGCDVPSSEGKNKYVQALHARLQVVEKVLTLRTLANNDVDMVTEAEKAFDRLAETERLIYAKVLALV